MRSKVTTSLTLAAALALAATAPAVAQQHKATRLGNPATRFAKPLKKADDLRVLLRSEKTKADIVAILRRPAGRATTRTSSAPPPRRRSPRADRARDRIPFMSSRKNASPTP